MVHNQEVLLSINSQYWEVKEGKYSYKDRDLYPSDEKFYEVCYNPLAFGYSALWDSEVLFNDRITTEVKVGLIKHLANIFHSKMQWQQQQRGRKISIEADLTRGGIVTGEKNFKMSIKYHMRSTDDIGGHLESFIIQLKGGGGILGRMPYEHMVSIDSLGNARLGYCLTTAQTKVCNDMSDIFKSVY